MMPQRGNIRLLFDPIDEITIDDALVHGADFHAAKERLIALLVGHPFGYPVNFEPWTMRRDFGLTVILDALALHDRNGGTPGVVRPPFGWRWMKEPGRDALRMMPVWLYWPMCAWRNRWAIYRPLIRLGFLVGAEGALYSSFRWNWHFWRSQRAVFGPVTPWQRFAYWCLRKEYEYRATMPRTFSASDKGWYPFTLGMISRIES